MGKASVDTLRGLGPKSVSYTHLDVYKRQVLCRYISVARLRHRRGIAIDHHCKRHYFFALTRDLRDEASIR